MKGTYPIFRCVRVQYGFSLIELMIAVVIVSILSAIAYPSYVSYTVKSKRAAAEAFIMGVASKQEQYLLDARQYATDLTTLGMTLPQEVSGNYSVSISNVGTTPPTYTVTAAPTGGQATRDTDCGSVSIDQAGTKGITGSSSVANCW